MAKPKVEVARDALGWLLVYVADQPTGQREGEPIEDPDTEDVRYFRTRAAAKKAAAAMNGEQEAGL